MQVQAILYFLLTIMLEFAPYGKPKLAPFKKWWNDLTFSQDEITSSHTLPLLGADGNVSVAISSREDEDVAAERQRVLDGHVSDAVIFLCNLRKVLEENHFLFNAKKMKLQKKRLSANCQFKINRYTLLQGAMVARLLSNH
jgi:hypothetical protein